MTAANNTLLETLKSLHDTDRSGFHPFMIAGYHVGWIHHSWSPRVLGIKDVFVISDPQDLPETVGTPSHPVITLHPDLSTMEERTAAVQMVVNDLTEQGHLPPTPYVVPQYYPVMPKGSQWGDDHTAAPLMIMRRYHTTMFGVTKFGVQVHGYTPDGYWLSTRSKHVATYAGKYDTLVGSGQPHGIAPLENAIREGEEETQLSEKILRTMRPSGTNHICTHYDDWRITEEVIHSFDLALTHDQVPHADGQEFARHTHVSFDELQTMLDKPKDFKTAVYPVIINFLMRHGHLHDATPHYDEIRTLSGHEHA